MPTQTYSEIKHSLKAIQISKLELFQFSAISSDKLMVWLISGGVGEYTVHMSLIIKLDGMWNILFYVDTS